MATPVFPLYNFSEDLAIAENVTELLIIIHRAVS